MAEPGSGEQEMNWAEASGEGVVYATTTIYPRPPASAYNIAIITLAEGPRLMSRVEHVEPEEVTIGMAVRAEIGEDDNGPILLFRPSDDIA
ncbi:Zn-ribbon domain-containing OB-fold protein [Sphingobium sp.]|uniref:Zn-ribbon domain-containing OB-fold protein n=1 Tax=Sphingobium sp. TaxID=1912891 RepID=UPI0035C77735